jgi:hypothetical protein
MFLTSPTSCCAKPTQRSFRLSIKVLRQHLYFAKLIEGLKK